MKLNNIHIEGFKSIGNAEICFDGRDTVIFGVNGTGKSTILCAVNFLARTWINRIIKRQSKEAEKFTDNDITVGMDVLNIGGEFFFNDKVYVLRREYERSVYNDRSNSLTYIKRDYDDFVDDFRKCFLSEQSRTMPIYVFYGTNRSVLKIPDKFGNQRYDMISALEGAIDSSVDFKNFFAWYRDRESNETIEIRGAMDSGSPVKHDAMLERVRFAIEYMLENVSDLRIRRDPVRMTVNKEGKEVRVDMLSDGEKCTLALFGDLARRLCLANPGMDNPLDGEGIVLIDEIELHMHPSWQRKVLNKLTTLFPNIQFIVTTHSPQVLGEADNRFKIFAIDESSKKIETVSRLDGYDSNFILETYMGTASKCENTQKLIDSINKCIAKKQYDEAEEKLRQLRDITGEDNEDYIFAKGFLERSRMFDA